MKASGAIDSAVFSIYINLNEDTSKISFGGYDLNLFAAGPISWHYIISGSPYWSVDMDALDYQFGNQTTTIAGSQSLIVDTGTSYNLFPQSYVIGFINNL